MRKRRLAPLALSVALAISVVSLVSTPARAVTVERIVALVGEKPILLTDLRRRARPYLRQIYATVQNPVQISVEEQKIYKQVLDKMITDRLVEQAADKAHLGVTEEEVDDGLKQQAIENGVSLKDFLAAARNKGFSESEYREEFRREITEGKLVQLRVAQRVRTTEDDARVAYQRYVRELGNDRLVEVRILARRIPGTFTDAQIAEESKLGADIVRRARSGEDFCALIQQFSQDTASKRSCGSPGPVPIGQLVPPVDDIARGLHEGETSEPVHVADVMLIVQMSRGPFIPTFAEARKAMFQRAGADILEREKKAWYQELRRGAYVDVRF